MRAAFIMLLPLVASCAMDLDSLRAPETADTGRPPVETMAPPPPEGDAGDPFVPDPVPEPTCGRVGLPCCTSGASCATGSCLRGICAVFGGTFGNMSVCSPDCQTRNPYTAGCSCPAGFVPEVVPQVLGSCVGAPGASSVTVCSAPLTEGRGDFAGAFVVAEAGACSEGGCVVPNERVGGCACPDGATELAMKIELSSGCGAGTAGTLTLCRQARETITFEGAFQHAPDGSCDIENPTTNACACGPDTMEQIIPTLPTPIHVCARR